MKLKKFRDWREDTKILLLRAWIAGAVCFFGAWGRSGSEVVGAAYSLDLIAGLILILLIADWIIVNPIIRMGFHPSPLPVALPEGFAGGILRVTASAAKNIVIGLLIVLSYYLLNTLFIAAFSLDATAVPVPLEPILFGILYGVYYAVGRWLLRKLLRAFARRKAA
jgi:hypothetical protein